jgi:hypothetical protein
MSGIEKRQNVRRKIAHDVFMETGLGPPLKCSMLDVSEFGARIKAEVPSAAPQEFLIHLHDGLTRWCRVMWRSDTEIGIKFIQPPQSLKAKSAAASRRGA